YRRAGNLERNPYPDCSRARAHRQAGRLGHHRHLARRARQACRALGRRRYCRLAEAASRRMTKGAAMEGEMLKGHLDMIVLAALASGPAHGYAVIEEIRHRSGKAFDLPEGTIYPALHRLELAGLLSSNWTTPPGGRKRRIYSLTKTGSSALAER